MVDGTVLNAFCEVTLVLGKRDITQKLSTLYVKGFCGNDGNLSRLGRKCRSVMRDTRMRKHLEINRRG